MTRDEFIQKAVSAGLSDNDIKSAMNDRRQSIGTFDDEAQTQQPPPQQSPQQPTNSQALGNAVKAVATQLVPEPIRDLPKLASTAWNVGKGAIQSLGQVFNNKNWTNAIDNPSQAPVGLGKGAAQFGYNTLSGMLQSNPNFQQLTDAEQGMGIQPQGMPKSFEATPQQQGAANLANAGLTLGSIAAPIKGIVKGSISAAKTISPAAVDQAIETGVSKGIKPTVIGKPSQAKMDAFYNNADQAVKTIADHKEQLNISDANGDAVTHPQTAAQMAQAIDQTKKLIYDKYNAMAQSAGDAGAQFNAKPILSKLDEIASKPGGMHIEPEVLSKGDPRLKYPRDVREYAYKLKSEIEELNGASPEIIQERIKDLNSSLAGYYAGRTAKAQAQIDASVANVMRNQLDDNITNAVGNGYQGLKQQYSALKSIENEVNKRALVNARRAPKGVADLTDIFTGGELATGLLTMNPALILKGAAGMGIKGYIKNLNNPDKYINNMFSKVYKSQAVEPVINTAPTPEAASNIVPFGNPSYATMQYLLAPAALNSSNNTSLGNMMRRGK